MKVKFTFLALFTIFLAIKAQNIPIEKCEIKWKGVETWRTEQASGQVLTFSDAHFPYGVDLPYVEKKLTVDTAFGYEVSVVNPVFAPLTDEESALLSGKKIPENIQVQSFVSNSRHNSFLNVLILPFVAVDGKIERLTNFDIQIEKRPKSSQEVAANRLTYAAGSVLATGKFVKVKIKESGIYKLTYEALNSMGIQPANVRVFGYGGALLEQDFTKPKPDDLPEVAVWMEKGSDGVFNAGDYILFYGQGVTRWKYDTAKRMFTHTLNSYSTEGYYFITSDAGGGKKIGDKIITLPAGATTIDVNTFVDYQVHELELYSVWKSGKVFYGEEFTSSAPLNLTFQVPNMDETSSLKARVDVAAISMDNSSFTLKLNNANPQTINIDKISDSFTIGVATERTYSFPAAGATNVVFNLTYNQPNGSSKGLLNFLEVNAKRKLIMTGAAMFFRNVDNLYKSSYNHYQLSGANNNVQIWDITDPSNIQKIATSRNGDFLEFYDTCESVKEYVAIDPSAKTSFTLEPAVAGVAPNQNIHGMNSAELTVITHPSFLAQAEKLAQAHRNKEGMSVNVVTTEQVYNEFSSGTPDATAYRWMMRMFYDRSKNDSKVVAPSYLLLFGRGSYDNRGIIPNSGDNLVLTYQSDVSLHKMDSYVTDDYFGLLDSNEGLNVPSDLPDLGIGRFPVSTVQQADDVVNKTMSYMDNKIKGNWKNQLCFLGDDGDNAQHAQQADRTAQLLSAKNPGYQYNKIYLDAYPQEKAASGDEYPLATKKLHHLIHSGLFMLNYTGHAGPYGWTDEKVMVFSDVKNMYNPKLPIWVAATCDFVLFDQKNISAGEYVLLNPSGGGIALFSAARTVFATKNEVLNRFFTTELFNKINGKYPRLGDVVAQSKIKTGSEINKLSYMLFGDPALKLNYPNEYKVVTEKLNHQPVQLTDTLRALSVDSIQGYVADINGDKMTDFNGFVDITILDKIQKITTLNNHNDGAMTYLDRPNILYSGKADVKNGNFSFKFMVPKDIRYNYGAGRISYYAADSVNDREAQGYYENFVIGGSASNYKHETDGPVIQMYLNTPNFVSGDKVNETPLFVANISDVSGINTVGSGIGHDLRLVIDNDPYTSYTLNEHFNAAANSYQLGALRWKLPEMADGKHTITLHAWDLLNNSSEATLEFEVVKGLTPSIFSVSNYPNPVVAGAETTFVIEHDRPEVILQTSVDVYDLAGRRIYTFRQNNAENIKWNLTDNSGKKIPQGVYLYRIWLKTTTSEYTSKSNKIIVVGQ